MSPNSSSLAAIRQFQSETAAIREAPEPIAARATLYVLSALVVAVIAILFLTRMDRIVTSVNGVIMPLDQITVIQPLDPSIIKSIDIHEGDEVKAGQLLGTLDPTFTSADLAQYRLQVASLEAQVIRDKAELSRQPLVFPDRTEPEFKSYAAIQKALYDQRRAQYVAQIASYDSKISQTEATIRKLQVDQDGYAQRDQVLKKVEDMRAVLSEHGTGSDLNLFLSQDARLEVLRNIEYDRNSLQEALQQLESTKADKKTFIEQWDAALSQDLVTTQNSLDTARSSLDKAAKHQDLVVLNAAEPSIVLTLAKVSVGSVLTQGAQFMTLMPLRTRLQAELQIASKDIGFVRTNDACTLKIDAFNFVEHGTAIGKVIWISEGAFTTDANGNPVPAYYKARCSVDSTNFFDVPKNFRLIPGMTLEGDVNVGTRSVAMYMLSGILRMADHAMREPGP